MPQTPPCPPEPNAKLNLSEPLFDNLGRPHQFITCATRFQIVTMSNGTFFVWDKTSGECMIRGLDRLRLVNTISPKRQAFEPVSERARSQMPEAAALIDRLRRESASSALRQADHPEPGAAPA